MFKNIKNNNLPVGWQQASIENISERIHYGYTASAENLNTGVKLLRITDIQNRNVDWHEVPFCEISEQELAKYELKDGDLVFARTGATVGKSYLIKGKIPKAVFASYLIRIILHNEIDKQFVYYFFQSPSYWQQIGMRALGIGQPNVNATTLSSLGIPLPPLAEQHRIVAKIEELFSDLDAGIASLKQAQAQLKTYRQAVLKYAFEGKLTTTWREQNKPESAEKLLAQIQAEREMQYLQQLDEWQKADVGRKNKKKPSKPQKPKEFPPLTEAELAGLLELPDGWCRNKMGNLTFQITDGTHLRPQYVETGVPFLSVKNVRPGLIYDDDIKYISVEQHTEYIRRCKPERHDILYTKVGVTYGYAAINTLDYEFSIYVSLCLIKYPQALLLPKYVGYCMNSNVIYNQAKKRIKGIGRPDLHLEEIREFVFPVAPLPEQHQIVQEIETRLSVCDKLEESIKESLQRAEALRQSILKKAFAGKLVPQDPDDEPAEKLLERIWAEKNRAQNL